MNLPAVVLALAVAVAGGLGAASRYAIDATAGVALARRGRPGWALASINIGGSFLIGLIAGAASGEFVSAQLQAVAAAGFLGGFTTFSAASLDIVETDRRDGRNAAIARALIVPIGAVALCALGYWLAQA